MIPNKLHKVLQNPNRSQRSNQSRSQSRSLPRLREASQVGITLRTRSEVRSTAEAAARTRLQASLALFEHLGDSKYISGARHSAPATRSKAASRATTSKAASSCQPKTELRGRLRGSPESSAAASTAAEQLPAHQPAAASRIHRNRTPPKPVPIRFQPIGFGAEPKAPPATTCTAPPNAVQVSDSSSDEWGSDYIVTWFL